MITSYHNLSAIAMTSAVMAFVMIPSLPEYVRMNDNDILPGGKSRGEIHRFPLF